MTIFHKTTSEVLEVWWSNCSTSPYSHGTRN